MKRKVQDNATIRGSSNPSQETGWAWLVLIAAHCSRALGLALFYSSGPFIVEWLEYFEQSAAVTSWIFSLAYLVMGFLSLFVGRATSKLGIRPVVILGGAFLFLGFLVSVFAQRIEHLFITIGVMLGTGMGLVNASSMLIVGIYFKKKLNIAHGVTMVGSCTGQLIFVTLFAYLNTKYGWRGTMLILTGLCANVIVCGAIFRPLKQTVKRTYKIDSHYSQVELLEQEGAYQENLLNELFKERGTAGTMKNNVCCEKTSIFRCFDLKRIGKISAINMCMENSMITLFQLGAFCTGASIAIPLAHLVNKAVVGGIDKEKAAMLATIMGAGSLLSRGGYGWFVDKGYISAHTLFLISILFCAVESLTFVLTDIYNILAVLCFIYGFHFGIVACLTCIIPRLLVTPEQVSQIIGLTLFVHSMGNVFGPILAGWLYDVTSSYTASFVTCAGIYGLAAVLFIPIYCFFCVEITKPGEDKP